MATPSLNESIQTTSKKGDISFARQRRRRTTRNSGTKSLNHTELQNGYTRPPTLTESLPDTLLQTPTAAVNGNGDTVGTTGTARQRRTQRKRDSVRNRIVTPSFTPQPELEDSTAGVASLLEKKLNQTEKVTGPSQDVTDDGVIANPRTESPNHSPSEVEPPGPQEDEEPSNAEQRPLPPPLLDQQGDGLPTSLSQPMLPLSNEIFGIIVHRTDILRASVNISHPCIRVSVVDISDEASGAYARKSNPTKCVTSYYETGNPAVDYILPVLTQPFESSDRSKSLQPEWEEMLIFNEHPTHFTDNEKLVIFFEVLDFPTSASRAATSQWQTRLDISPWYKIAWAFLLPSGKMGKTQMGEKCRLQLFRYPKRRLRRSPESTEVYNLWSRGYRTAYPSTLYVTLKPIANSPIDSALPSPQPFRRSMLPTQREEGSVTFEQLLLKQLPSTNSATNLVEPLSKLLSASARLPGQACHIPSTNHATLYPAKMGCSALVFSNSGRLLAAGCASNDTSYPVIVFEVPSFKTMLVTEGHRGIVYSLAWTQNDQVVASASADGLVKLWSLSGPSGIEPLAVLPHPCYVYSVCFASSEDRNQLVFTGAYDSTIRVWSIDSDFSYKLVSELRGHTGLINCLVYYSSKRTIYAGDSKGQLGVWQEKQGVWQMKKRISIVNASPLVSLSLHPSGRKMLLHTDKGQLVMVDLRIERACCEFQGLLLSRSHRCSSFISPCGGLVFAGGNGKLNVWKSDDGTLQHTYTELPFTTTVCAMAYHPSEHMLAVSAFGSHQPLVIYTHITHGPDSNVANSASQQVSTHDNDSVGNENRGRPSIRQDSMILHLNQRLRKVTKTLNRSTVSRTGETKIKRK